jgi:hypothetical protein
MNKIDEYYKRAFLNLVVEYPTNNIIVATHSERVAKAVALASRKLRVQPIEQWAHYVHDSMRKVDIKRNQRGGKFFKMGSGNGEGRTVEEIPQEEVTPELRTLRRESVVRLYFHETLCNLCDSMIYHYSETDLHVEYSPYIIDQVNKCRPEEGYYTDAIHAYALSAETSDFGAYQELKMHMDNMAHARLRNLAIYIKFRNMMNATRATESDLTEVLKKARFELWKGSLV